MAGLTLYSDKFGIIDGDNFDWRNEDPKRTIRPAFKNWEISAMLQKLERAVEILHGAGAKYTQIADLVAVAETLRERATKAGH